MPIDLDKLESLLNKKASLEDMKKGLGVKNKLSIQAAVGRLMAQKGKVYEVPAELYGLPGGGGRGASRTVLNGKQGLRLSKTRMESLGFKGGERFEPVKTDDGILLKEV